MRAKKLLVPFGINILLAIIKTFVITKNLLSFLFMNVLYKPLKLVFGAFLHRFLVKSYFMYRGLMKRLGWNDFSQSFFGFIFNQKFVHIVVVVITVIIVFSNTATKSKAYASYESSGNTILYSLVTSEFGTLEEEQLIEEFSDQEAVISPTQQMYLDNIANIQDQPRVLREAPEDTNKENLVPITQEGSALVKPEIASTKKTKRPRTESIEYTVQPDDSVSTIASNFEISVNTVLWENSLSAYSIIRPGDKLMILPSSGITYKVESGDTLASIADDYDTDEDKILSANKIARAENLRIGDKIFIPDGKKPTYASYSPNTYTGYTAIKSLVKPSDSKPVAGNKMNWPTDGHTITQYFSWRHYGLDIANKIGTPIYAADAGTIEVLGWGTGYGNQIVIDHGGGKKTRYAHMSQFFVSKGDTVEKGQVIGAMGSTGWSTGPHLHFEVIINGTRYNPLNYIK